MRPNYLTVDDVITEEEIATIHEKMFPKLTRAKIGNPKDKWKRRSRVAWIANDEEHADVNEVMEKLCSVLRDVSRQHWKVELPVIEAIQYTHYAIGEWYGWHVDVGECAGPHRIVSASVELDDPKDYYGGGLKFFDHTQPNPPRRKGMMTLFPSMMCHKAKTVWWGKRRSLVMWAGFG